MKKTVTFSLALLVSATAFSQAPAKWSVAGNATSNGDFLGTTNNNPLVFYTNNLEVMRLKANGELKVNSLGGNGRGLITTNNNGVLSTTVYPQDTNKVFTGNGSFRSVATLTGWTLTGNDIYNTNPGDIYVSGTVHASGLLLANKMEADTLKGVSEISVSNNLHFSGGGLNEMYTHTGDIRLQSHSGSNGNVIMNAATNGNVGIGMFAPVYKLDVSGDVRISNKLYIYRILPLPGDSAVHIGDSSVVISNRNQIYTNTAYLPDGTPIKGLAFGSIGNYAYGLNSMVMGQKVLTSAAATNAFAIGTGVIGGSGYLQNTIANSMMIGFNSDKPTVFISAASGAGTTGAVCIGDSYTPTAASGIKLAVKGKIMAEDVEVKLRNTWPDYVFDPSYALMSFDSLQHYITANKHLPDSRSAAQMEQSGISVSESVSIQQQQIEQLTLYILQLNERMKALEAENAALRTNTNH